MLAMIRSLGQMVKLQSTKFEVTGRQLRALGSLTSAYVNKQAYKYTQDSQKISTETHRHMKKKHFQNKTTVPQADVEAGFLLLSAWSPAVQ